MGSILPTVFTLKLLEVFKSSKICLKMIIIIIKSLFSEDDIVSVTTLI